MLNAYPRHPRVSRRSTPGECGECILRGLDDGRLLSAYALRLKKMMKLREMREKNAIAEMKREGEKKRKVGSPPPGSKKISGRKKMEARKELKKETAVTVS